MPDLAVCPRCRQRAPIMLRGIQAYCTACNTPRMPFTGTRTVNLAGKGSRIGGAAARFFGWAAVIFGLCTSLFVTLVLQSIWSEGMLGYAFGIPIAVLSLAFGGALVFGGKQLGKAGDDAQRAARLEAIRGLATHRGGAITTNDVMRQLTIPQAEADAILTDLARRPEENVTLDLDDNGNIFWLFGVQGEDLREARWRFAQPQLEPSARDVAAEAEAAAYEHAQAAPKARR
jgi:hypothetical protein